MHLNPEDALQNVCIQPPHYRAQQSRKPQNLVQILIKIKNFARDIVNMAYIQYTKLHNFLILKMTQTLISDVQR